MQIRDRVKELRRVRADSLRPNPRNWRTHPDRQRDVLRGVLVEIGYADALLVRELPDGTLELIDGHLRAETTPEAEVPVLVLDLTDDEAGKLLAVLDPLASLAGTDRDALAGLLETVETQNEAVGKLLDELLEASRSVDLPEAPPAEIDLPEAFQIVVECRDEADQRGLFERLRDEGYECRLLSL